MSKMMVEQPNADRRAEHMRADGKCFYKAKDRGQLTFTLVEQDGTSPHTIVWWIIENIETCPAAKLYDALEAAILMREYKERRTAD